METQHSVVTAGSDRRIAFPDYCVNCNMPAGGRLRVQRVFERFSPFGGEGDFKVVTSFKVPFCHACINIHRQEEVSLTWQNWLMAFLMGGMLIVPALVIFFLSLNIWREFLQALTSVDLILSVFYGALSALSLAVVTMLLVVARHLSRPHLVVPPTSITSAIDFSDRDKTRVFRFRHKGYADRFREANRKRLWSPDQSHKVIPWRWIFRLFLLGMVVVALWWLLSQGVL